MIACVLRNMLSFMTGVASCMQYFVLSIVKDFFSELILASWDFPKSFNEKNPDVPLRFFAALIIVLLLITDCLIAQPIPRWGCVSLCHKPFVWWKSCTNTN